MRLVAFFLQGFGIGGLIRFVIRYCLVGMEVNKLDVGIHFVLLIISFWILVVQLWKKDRQLRLL